MITYPLNDVEYLAEDAELFNCPRKSGVYAENSFEYALTGGNEITIGKGIAWIKNAEFAGKVVANKSSVALDAGIADAFHPRIDAVVIQFDAVANKTKLIIKKGVASASPEPPEVERTETIYELHLYHIERLVGDAALYSGQITDLRMSEEYCGLMAEAITEIDTSAIFAQYMDMLNNFEEKVGEIVTEDLTAAKESGEFDPVKGVDYWTAEDKEEIIEEAVSRDFGSQGLAYTLNADGASYSVSGIGECPDEDITIPSRHEGKPVTKILDDAFSENRQIKSVVIPKSVKTIGYSFDSCSNLKSVVCERGVEEVAPFAFSADDELEFVELPDTLKIIGQNAFQGNHKMKRIHLHAGLEKIGANAFATGAEIEVIFHGTGEQWSAIDLADGWATSYKLFVTYNGDMVGATDNFNGASGYVPAPPSKSQGQALLGDGTWGYPVGISGKIEASKISGSIPASQISGALPIGHGGTGATTKANARKNLGIYATSATVALDGGYLLGANSFGLYCLQGETTISAVGITQAYGHITATAESPALGDTAEGDFQSISTFVEKAKNEIKVRVRVLVTRSLWELWQNQQVPVNIIYIV